MSPHPPSPLPLSAPSSPAFVGDLDRVGSVDLRHVELLDGTHPPQEETVLACVFPLTCQAHISSSDNVSWCFLGVFCKAARCCLWWRHGPRTNRVTNGRNCGGLCVAWKDWPRRCDQRWRLHQPLRVSATTRSRPRSPRTYQRGPDFASTPRPTTSTTSTTPCSDATSFQRGTLDVNSCWHDVWLHHIYLSDKILDQGVLCHQHNYGRSCLGLCLSLLQMTRNS